MMMMNRFPKTAASTASTSRYQMLSTSDTDTDTAAAVIVSSHISNGVTSALLLMQSYGYRVIAFLIIIFICMQFLLNFSPYNHNNNTSRLTSSPGSMVQPLPFKYDRRNDPDVVNSFLLEDMDMAKGSAHQQQLLSRGYLSRSDYVYPGTGSGDVAASSQSSDLTAAAAASSITKSATSRMLPDPAAAPVSTSKTAHSVSSQTNSSLSPPHEPAATVAAALKPCPAVPPKLGKQWCCFDMSLSATLSVCV